MSAAAVSSRGMFISGSEKDYNHVSDKQYTKFRQLADNAYKQRDSFSQKSQNAYKNGNKAEAKDLSIKANQQLAIAEENNRKAAEYVFIENNRDSDDNDIDLHGLYVKEAEYILKQRIISGIRKNQSTLDCIVGKGLHSQNGVAKLKPAIQNLCNDANLNCWIDKKNTGILHIDIQNARIPQDWYNVNPNGVGAMDETYYSFHPEQRPSQSYQPIDQQQKYSQPPQNTYQNQNQHQYQQQPQQYHQQQQQYQQSPSNGDSNNMGSCLVGILTVLVRSFCR